MDPNVTSDRIAVLIDADNASHRQLQAVLGEVAKYGNPTIKRVYGDWTSDRLSNWAPKLNSLGLRAVHQNAFTKGKNSTDMALVIDAMDLLYDGNVESFALVTSDSDFTALTHRLRESGKAVYVLGTQKAPTSLRNACDKFIDLDVLADTDDDSGEVDGDESPDSAPAINLQSALTRALNAVSDDDGWASLPSLGNQLVRTHPSFDPRAFAGAGARLSTLVVEQGYLETSGAGNAMRVRLKGAPVARKAVARKAADKAPEKTAEKAAEKAPDQAVEPAPAGGAEPAPATKTSTRKRTAKKQAAPQRAGSKKQAEPEQAEPEQAEPTSTAKKAAAKKTSSRRTARKTTKTPAKTAAKAEPQPVQPPAEEKPVVRVTTRTRSGRPVTPAGGTPTA